MGQRHQYVILTCPGVAWFPAISSSHGLIGSRGTSSHLDHLHCQSHLILHHESRHSIPQYMLSFPWLASRLRHGWTTFQWLPDLSVVLGFSFYNRVNKTPCPSCHPLRLPRGPTCGDCQFPGSIFKADKPPPNGFNGSTLATCRIHSIARRFS